MIETIKKPTKKLNLVQLFRGLAILFVMVGHINSIFNEQFGYDWLNMGSWGRTGGVDFFFVISGFMIYYLYSKNIGIKGKAKDFLLKRCLRIFPLYWLVMLATVFLFFLFPQLGKGNETSISTIVKNVFLYPDTPILAVTWSLSHVVFFYILFSLLIVKPKIFKPIIFTWILISILIYSELPLFESLNWFIFDIQNLELWAGAFTAYIVKNFNLKSGSFFIIIGAIGFILLWINNIYNFLEIDRRIYFCLASLSIMIGIASIDLKKEVKLPKIFSYFGDASYSIFITHSPFLQFYVLIFEKTGILNILGYSISMIFALLLAVISGCLTYSYLEKPLSIIMRKIFLNLPNKNLPLQKIS
ncbi:hypothetical protein HMPREF3291_04380 [Bacillus sp. HMSC76G11]|nr:hypothetical protein HMPREF3291_04380 [Bacillus sp. HMSC76G11]